MKKENCNFLITKNNDNILANKSEESKNNLNSDENTKDLFQEDSTNKKDINNKIIEENAIVNNQNSIIEDLDKEENLNEQNVEIILLYLKLKIQINPLLFFLFILLKFF